MVELENVFILHKLILKDLLASPKLAFLTYQSGILYVMLDISGMKIKILGVAQTLGTTFKTLGLVRQILAWQKAVAH